MTLPNIIKDFIKAANNHDGQALIDTFAKDAMVNDFSRTFNGVDTIKKWSDKELIGDKVTFEVDEAVEHYGEWMVTALTDGNYDKTKAPDPLYLDHFFTIHDNRIVRLIITKNVVKSAK